MMYNLSQQAFEQLHRDLDKVRSTSKTVTISKEALRCILLDHADYAAIVDKTVVVSKSKTPNIEDLV